MSERTPAEIIESAQNRVAVLTRHFGNEDAIQAVIDLAKRGRDAEEMNAELMEVLKRLVFDCKADGLQHKAGFDCWIAAADELMARALKSPRRI